MKTNTLRQRLAVYKKALNDYENSGKYTREGFCNYFTEMRLIFYCSDLKIKLPELCRYKPKDMIWFWFPLGELPPRIALLKKAIRYTESQIKKGKK